MGEKTEPHVLVLHHQDCDVPRRVTFNKVDPIPLTKARSYRVDGSWCTEDDRVIKKLLRTLQEVHEVREIEYSDGEISVVIFDSCEWQDVGPHVLGMIVKHLFPDAVMINVSMGLDRNNRRELKWDRVIDLYKEWLLIPVSLGDPPILDIEEMLKIPE